MLAVTVKSPAPLALSSPPEEMLADAPLDKLQAAVEVTFFVEPSLYCALASSCRVSPMRSEVPGPPIVMLCATGAGGEGGGGAEDAGDPAPPHETGPLIASSGANRPMTTLRKRQDSGRGRKHSGNQSTTNPTCRTTANLTLIGKTENYSPHRVHQDRGRGDREMD
jgi:hypothetical protein